MNAGDEMMSAKAFGTVTMGQRDGPVVVNSEACPVGGGQLQFVVRLGEIEEGGNSWWQSEFLFSPFP